MTIATFTALLILRNQDGLKNINTESQWFELHQTVKSQTKSVLERAKASGDVIVGVYLTQLPVDSGALNPQLQEMVFGRESPGIPLRLCFENLKHALYSKDTVSILKTNPVVVLHFETVYSLFF